MRKHVKFNNEKWKINYGITNHAAERMLERKISEWDISQNIDQVLPFIMRTAINKFDTRRLIIRDEKRDHSIIIDGIKVNHSQKQVNFKVVTAINDLKVCSGELHKDTRLAKVLYGDKTSI